MTRFPGVTRRSDSSVFWFCLRAPKDLREHFSGPWAVRISLQTTDLREANEKARQFQAEWAEKFARLRKASRPQPVALSPAIVAAIAAELRRWVLQADDNARDFPEAARGMLLRQARKAVEQAPPELAELLPSSTFLQPLQINAAGPTARPATPPMADPLGGLSAAEGAALAGWNAGAAADSAINVARRNVRAIQPLANEVSRSLGLAVDWSGPDAREALLECLRAYHQANAEVVQRDAGAWIETPVQAPPVVQVAAEAEDLSPQDKPGHLLTLRDLFELWKLKPARRGGKLALKTIARGLEVVQAFEKACGNPRLIAVTRQHALQLRDYYRAKGIAPKTVKDRLDWVGTLFRFESDEQDRLSGNPWPRLKVEGSSDATVNRRDTRKGELASLFSLPLFQSYALPTAANAGRDAAYWVPVLGAYTGARITELAQLLTADVYEDGGLWLIDFRVTDPSWQSLKNRSSWRRIPVHPELVRLGFLDYCESMRGAGHERLFPLVKVSKVNNAGGALSSWFSKLKNDAGWGKQHSFHSFRHGVETILKRAKEPKSHTDRYTGHSGKDVADRTYTHLEARDLVETAAKIRPEGLELPRVFPPTGWSAPAVMADVLKTARRE